MHRVLPLLVVALILALTACGDDGPSTTDDTSGTGSAPTSQDTSSTESTPTSQNASTAETLYPDVVGVEAVHDGDGTWTFHVTLSSPYDSPERYADAWRVVGPDGTVFGERILLHDHAAEQPFTRSQSGIEIPADVSTVTVEGRDQVSGWGGETMDVELQR